MQATTNHQLLDCQCQSLQFLIIRYAITPTSFNLLFNFHKVKPLLPLLLSPLLLLQLSPFSPLLLNPLFMLPLLHQVCILPTAMDLCCFYLCNCHLWCYEQLFWIFLDSFSILDYFKFVQYSRLFYICSVLDDYLFFIKDMDLKIIIWIWIQ